MRTLILVCMLVLIFMQMRINKNMTITTSTTAATTGSTLVISAISTRRGATKNGTYSFAFRVCLFVWGSVRA